MNDIIIETALPESGDALQARLRALRTWKAERVAEVQGAAKALTADNYREAKLNAFDGLDKRLKACEDEVAAKALPDAAKALLVELAATRVDVKAATEDRKSVLRALKDANDPKPEEFEYLLEFRASQKAAEAVLKKLDKDGVPFRYRRVKDGESARIGKLFDDGKEAK